MFVLIAIGALFAALVYYFSPIAWAVMTAIGAGAFSYAYWWAHTWSDRQ